LEGVLQTIIIEKSNVGYQAKWKSYYIKTGLDEITMVIFSIIEDDEKNDYVIRAAFYFGDTTNQSRSFYKKNIPFSAFEKSINSGWHLAPDFHISSINTHLVWFLTDIDKQQYYYEYWINHMEKLEKGYLKYHKKIAKLGLIDDTNKLKELDDKIINTKRTTVNICPALMIYWDIPSSVVIEKDDAGKIEEYFKEILNLGLSVINERPKTIIE
jgi:hypothetical protein